MIRITKGDITLECETQADVKLALGVFADVDEPALPSITVPVEVNAPAWRVGGPSDPLPTMAGSVHVSGIPSGIADKPKLAAVPESGDSDPKVVAPPMIPVSRCNLEVLEAIMLFTEGVPTRGLQELLGLTQTTISGRIARLQETGLIERVPHRNLWRATTLARRAKLVRS